MQLGSLITLFEKLTVSEMRGLIEHIDSSGRVKLAVPSGNPSRADMARETVNALANHKLIHDRLFDRLAEVRPKNADEVQRVRNLWELQWDADRVLSSAKKDAEATADQLVAKIRRQAEAAEEAVKEAKAALSTGVQLALQRTAELRETVERAKALERALDSLRLKADESLAGIRAFQSEAARIVQELRELTPQESEAFERKREEEPDRFDQGTVERPKLGGLLWPVGATIRAKFLGGTDVEQRHTRDAAAEWSRYANVKFEFTEDKEAEIRIAFDPNGGSWAYQGTQALGVASPAPTVNLGWVKNVPSTALHELGHVLGLIHEFQNPKANIPWNRDVVYGDLSRPPNNWTLEQVNTKMLLPASEDDYTDYREFDPESIMMFSMPASWVRDGEGYVQSQTLTESDKALIRRLYPFSEDQPQ